ncbi:hypothetical protein SAMD00019534_060440 [Acytostelium subglobosum LB1]|uniref:hypothetical protein n=1 Tax=Acytostelium subglobosum LB1 TaxID=1410327 RepID=UPI000645035C|nr:hypothetical protein SAMD00019534_060440 [Acytostelium subglobosum LB1]GAM22869.1 hypothetical protein SAMD00019534_060440 [Acytostelium subglobosum LB1]|eukprot:XP_012754096.1 hypothetical protein SAMD00019534_060440 [Acytostelium subglobosum LB1]
MTYSQVNHNICIVGSALKRLLPNRSIIGISSETCPEWYYFDYGSLLYGMITIPFHHQHDATCMVVSSTMFPSLVRLINHGDYNYIKLIVFLGDDLDQTLRQSLPDSITFKTFDQLFNESESQGILPHGKDKFVGDEIVTLFFTSGSTGPPKGIIYTERVLYHGVKLFTNTYKHQTIYSYATQAHIQRRLDIKTLYTGGQIGINSNLNNLIEDLKLLRPSEFVAVPRVWHIIYSSHLDTIHRLRLEHPEWTEDQVETEAINLIRPIFQPTNNSLRIGAAPVSQSIIDFMQKCWGDNATEIYGNMETFNITVNYRVTDNIQYRLEPVPSMSQEPNVGELWVKTPFQYPGYYKNPEASKAFADGWYRTGDLFKEIEPGYLKIVDRIKNTFKLSNGEFVHPEKIETYYNLSPLIQHILVYGSFGKPFLVAIVVPKKNVLQHCGLTSDDHSMDDLNKNHKLKSLIHNEISRLSKEKNVPTYEIPKMIMLDNTTWRDQNQLITASGKMARPVLCQYYKAPIDHMLQTLETLNNSLFTQQGDLESIVESYIKGVLGIDTSSNNVNMSDINSISFTDIGGDSIGAAKLSSILKDKQGINISAQFILSKDHSIGHILDIIKGNVTAMSKKRDWDAEFKLDQSIDPMGKPVKPIKSTGNNVFLTGATGFLGSHLLHDLLAGRNKAMVGKVYCLVRNVGSRAQAREKLVQHLTSKYQLEVGPNEAERIIPVIGDLSQKRFGLSEQQFIDIANDVHLIMHNGALVHLMNPYPNMKDANVGGTEEALRLACVGDQVVRVAHVSTIGTFGHLTKDTDDSTVPPVSNLDDHTLGGYGQTKLVAEQLVNEAKSRGLPTMVFRPGVIYAHSKSGIDNDNDMIRILMRGIMQLKCYPTDASCSSTGELINLSCVDWVSDSIVSLSLYSLFYNAKHRPPTYHMTNDKQVTIWEVCQAINKVVPLEQVTLEEFKRRLETQPNNVMYPVYTAFGNDLPFLSSHRFLNPSTCNDLATIGLQPAPEVDEPMLIKNIKYLQQTTI